MNHLQNVQGNSQDSISLQLSKRILFSRQLKLKKLKQEQMKTNHAQRVGKVWQVSMNLN